MNKSKFPNATDPMKKQMAIVVTSPMIAKFFLIPHIKLLSNSYDITLISNMKSNANYLDNIIDKVRLIDINIQRDIRLFADIYSLISLVKHFNKMNYDLVYSITPKGGLIATMAGRISGIPVRIHTFTGQVWATSNGMKKNLLKLFDKLISLLSSFILVDSISQRRYLLAKNIISETKSSVLASGSISGVDMDRFIANSESRLLFRSSRNISNETIVFLYLGRLKKDKGIFDLIEAYGKLLNDVQSKTKLIIVGPDEEGIINLLHIKVAIERMGIVYIPYVANPECVLAGADVLCLPSYREGFGNVVIEAASMGIPTIGYKIYGLTDAIVDGETGLCVELGDIDKYSARMHELVSNNALRTRLGNNSRQRVAEKFNEAILTNAFQELLLSKL